MEVQGEVQSVAELVSPRLHAPKKSSIISPGLIQSMTAVAFIFPGRKSCSIRAETAPPLGPAVAIDPGVSV